MEVFKGVITIKSNIEPENIDIIGIDIENKILIKYTINNQIHYINYEPRSIIYNQLFFEIINKSYLWNI